jgi:surface antigen
MGRHRSKSVDIKKEAPIRRQRSKSLNQRTKTEPNATSDQNVQAGVEVLAGPSERGLHPDDILVLEEGKSTKAPLFKFLNFGRKRDHKNRKVKAETPTSDKFSQGIHAEPSFSTNHLEQLPSIDEMGGISKTNNATVPEQQRTYAARQSDKAMSGIVLQRAAAKTQSEPADSHVIPHGSPSPQPPRLKSKKSSRYFQSFGQATSFVFNDRSLECDAISGVFSESSEECDLSSASSFASQIEEATSDIFLQMAESKTENEPADSQIPHSSPSPQPSAVQSNRFSTYFQQATSCVFNDRGLERDATCGVFNDGNKVCDPCSSGGEQAEEESLVGLKSEREIDKHSTTSSIEGNMTKKESLGQDAERNATPKDEQKELTDDDVAANKSEIEKHEASFVKATEIDEVRERTLTDSSDTIAAVDNAISRIKERAEQLGISDRVLLRAVSTVKSNGEDSASCQDLETSCEDAPPSRVDSESLSGSDEYSTAYTHTGRQASILLDAFRYACWQTPCTDDEYMVSKDLSALYSDEYSAYSDGASTLSEHTFHRRE